LASRLTHKNQELEGSKVLILVTLRAFLEFSVAAVSYSIGPKGE